MEWCRKNPERSIFNFYGAYHDAEKQACGEVVPPKLGIPAWTDFNSLVR